MKLIRIEHGFPFLDATTMTVLVDAEKRKKALFTEMVERDIPEIESAFVSIKRRANDLDIRLKLE